MSQRRQRPYEFEGLPLSPVEPGTSLLVTGPSRTPSRLAEALVLTGDADGDGMAFVSTNTTARTRVAQARATRPDVDLSRLGVVDATGAPNLETDTDAVVQSVSHTGDLTGISIRFSQVYTALTGRGAERIRTCFDSVSVLSLYTDHRTITRFVHTLAGRVATTDGLGVFVLTPSMHDPQTVSTLSHLCDGRVEVRHAEASEGHELRVTGLPGQPSDWASAEF